MSGAVLRTMEGLGFDAHPAVQDEGRRPGSKTREGLDASPGETRRRDAAAREALPSRWPLVQDRRFEEGARAKERLIRDAVAVITRRQAVLETHAPPQARDPQPSPAPPVPSIDGAAPAPSRSGDAGGAAPSAARTSPDEPPMTPPHADVDMIWTDIRALLDTFSAGSPIELLEHRMGDLAAKLDRHLAAPSSAALVQDLLSRIDALQSSIQAPGGARHGIEDAPLGTERHTDQVRAAPADVRRIQEIMNGLSKGVEAPPAGIETGTLTALEGQIARLSDRLARSESNLSTLDTIEQSLRDLVAQSEQTREATIEAAESAARHAARDALREVMRGPDAPDLRLDAVEKVANEVKDLKLNHERSEQRTHAALAGLHQVVERLVERLAADPVLAQVAGVTDRDECGSTRSAVMTLIASDPNGDDGVRKPGPAFPHHALAPPAADDGTPVRSPGSTAPALADEGGGAIGPPWAGSLSDPADGLIEPGRGAGPTRGFDFGFAEGTVARSGGTAAFIAAARTAAVASAASKRESLPEAGEALSSTRLAASALLLIERARGSLALRRRPLLAGLAGLAVLVGALEAAKVGLDASPRAPSVMAEAALPEKAPPAAEPAALDEPPALAPSPPSETTGSLPLDKATAPVPAPAVPGPSLLSPVVAAPHPLPQIPALSLSSTDPVANPNPFLADGASGLAGLGEGLRALALGGDPAAEYEVGMRYVQGRSVTRDPKAAAGWFEKAAAHGLAPAQYRLGLAFEKGLGRPRDPAQAMSWYERAADAGNIRAMHNLAVMVAEAAAGKPDYAKAAVLFEKAAALGVRDSQYNLAILYARGIGAPQNLRESYTWFALAAAQGDDDAARKRDQVATRLDPKTLRAAKDAASAFTPGPAVAAANDVPAPAGGWDAASGRDRSDRDDRKSGGGKAPMM